MIKPIAGKPVDENRSSSAGFTLIELMVVVVIVAVVMVVAAPGFSTLMQRTKLKSYANEMVSSVYIARSEAIKRNAEMKLCSSTVGGACDGGNNWEKGWIVIDPNNLVITHQPSLAGGYLMFDPNSVPVSEVKFKPTGVSSTAVTLKVCQNQPSDGIEEKEVTITATGRTRVETTTDGCP